MKKNEYENDFIMCIYRGRHKAYEPFVVIMVLVMIFFPLIGIPAFVLFEVSYRVGVALSVGVIPLVCVVLFIIKNIIIKRFVKIKNINEKIDIVELHEDELEQFKDETVFVFQYSEYMKKVLYNWLKSLSALKDDRLRMYKVYWNNGGSADLAICQNDLVVSEEKRNQYENETRHLVRLEDMENGKVVNVKLISRIMRE